MPLIEINIDDPYIFRLARIIYNSVQKETNIKTILIGINRIIENVNSRLSTVYEINNALVNIAIMTLYLLYRFKNEYWNHRAQSEYLLPINVFQSVEILLNPIIKECESAIQQTEQANLDQSIFHIELILKETFRLSSALCIDLIEEIKTSKKIRFIKNEYKKKTI